MDTGAVPQYMRQYWDKRSTDVKVNTPAVDGIASSVEQRFSGGIDALKDSIPEVDNRLTKSLESMMNRIDESATQNVDNMRRQFEARLLEESENLEAHFEDRLRESLKDMEQRLEKRIAEMQKKTKQECEEFVAQKLKDLEKRLGDTAPRITHVEEHRALALPSILAGMVPNPSPKRKHDDIGFDPSNKRQQPLNPMSYSRLSPTSNSWSDPLSKPFATYPPIERRSVTLSVDTTITLQKDVVAREEQKLLSEIVSTFNKLRNPAAR
ncbi:hypothetical protein V8C42DRAFT_361909 [Trichoderma barbatum]